MMKHRPKKSKPKPKATHSISSPNQNIDKNGVPTIFWNQPQGKAEYFEFSPEVINILAHLIVEMETENENNSANNNSSIHPTDS